MVQSLKEGKMAQLKRFQPKDFNLPQIPKPDLHAGRAVHRIRRKKKSTQLDEIC